MRRAPRGPSSMHYCSYYISTIFQIAYQIVKRECTLTTRTYAGRNLENVQFCLNEDLANVFNWLQANKLTLNMTKTEFMLIGSRQRLNTLTDTPTIRMNNTQVSQVTATKSLGVVIDDKLDWHCHSRIEKLTKKIASGIGALKRVGA